MALLSIGLAALFDYRRGRQTVRLTKKRQLSTTILVPAFNEARVIERCLKSIEKLRYKNYKVIVIDDASADDTAKIVRKFIKTTSIQSIRLVKKRKNTGKGAALNYALQRHVKSDITFILDADCTMHPQSLRHVMRAFADKTIAGVASNVRIAEDPTLLSYLQKVEFMLGFRHKRSFDAADAEFIIGGQGSAYRTDVIKQVGGFHSNMQTEDIALSLSVLSHDHPCRNLAFASDSLIYTEAVPTVRGLFKQRYRWKFGALQAVLKHKHLIFSRRDTHSRLLGWYRLPQLFVGEFMTFVEPFILFILIAASLYNTSMLPLAGAWISFSLYVATTVAIDEHTSRLQRVKLAALAPLLFPFFYLFSFINFVALLKTLRNWRQLIGISNVAGSWKPPTRVGKASL